MPEEAQIVRKIFELYVQGNGVRKIKKYLEEHGSKTEQTVSFMQIWHFQLAVPVALQLQSWREYATINMTKSAQVKAVLAFKAGYDPMMLTPAMNIW